jgi:hypothetical protein
MIADGPGNCLTPEEHAHVALLGQASGIAQLVAIGNWSVHSPCRMAEPPRGPNRGSGGFPQKRPPRRRHSEFGPADRNARWAIKSRAWLKRKFSKSRRGNSAFREVECSLRENSLHAMSPGGGDALATWIPFGSPSFESRYFCGVRGVAPRSPTAASKQWRIGALVGQSRPRTLPRARRNCR